nr:retrovirus-related Pol polyprotein from transposon TNT 1-94 [Tanacetum cinerariifolium]
MRHFGCLVTILNTLDHLGKFDGKADEGFLVGYSINSKAFRVYNSRTRKVKENLHVNFLEYKPNVIASGPECLFDIDSLTNSMNYQPVSAGNRTNGNTGLEINSDARQAGKEKEAKSSPKDDASKKSTTQPTCIEEGKTDDLGTALEDYYKLTNLKDTNIFDDAYDARDEGAETDYNNLETVILVSPIPSTGIYKDHPKKQFIGEMEPKKVTQALDEESWVEAMQEELL